jgi:hypothetical protein
MGIEDSNSALDIHASGGCANASAAASKIIAVANVASTEYLTIVRTSGTSGSCAFGACIWRAFQLPSPPNFGNVPGNVEKEGAALLALSL